MKETQYAATAVGTQSLATEPYASSPVDCLTKRERQVAELVATGMSTKQVAATLNISFHTARHHTERVFAKLGLRTRVEVAVLVVRCQAMG